MTNWSENNEHGMCVLLGITDGEGARVHMESVKIFLKNVWKKRKKNMRGV